MQGFFDAQVKDAQGLPDALFKRLKGKELDRLLAMLPTVQHAPETKNLITDNLPAWIFRHTMSGGAVSWPYTDGGVGGGGLCKILLASTDSEPTYQDAWASGYQNINEGENSVGSGAGKRFIEDHTESELITITPAKEELYIRERFLFTPSQAVSNNIRTISYWYGDNADATGDQDIGIFGSVRLKDSGGSPIVLNKTAAQVLLVQVIYKLVTI
jgi:hypothetical protein